TASGSSPASSTSACASSRTRTGFEARSPTTSPSRTKALVATSVAVSNARISTCKNALFQGFFVALQHEQSTCLPHVLQTDARPRGRQEACAGLGPLHEDNGVLEVLLQVSPLGIRHPFEPIEVEVRDVNPAFVPVPDRVGRARHRPLDAKRPSRPAHESRLARA